MCTELRCCAYKNAAKLTSGIKGVAPLGRGRRPFPCKFVCSCNASCLMHLVTCSRQVLTFVVVDMGFFTVRSVAERGIAMISCLSVCPSVCLPVCPSVTLVDCDHTRWNSSKIITDDFTEGLHFRQTPSRTYFKGNTPIF